MNKHLKFIIVSLLILTSLTFLDFKLCSGDKKSSFEIHLYSNMKVQGSEKELILNELQDLYEKSEFHHDTINKVARLVMFNDINEINSNALIRITDYIVTNDSETLSYYRLAKLVASSNNPAEIASALKKAATYN